MSSISERVQALYEKYPYPPREPCEAIDPYVDYVHSLSAESPVAKPSFLDAGCGTGSTVLGAALFQKDWDIYGCDFNQSSLQILERDVKELNLSNVSTRRVDLMEFPSDFGPPGGFDVIFCTGVIHHTPDPVKVLKNLAARLAPQGVLRLMVYSQRGRSDLYRFVRALQSIKEWRERGLEERLSASRGLLRELARSGKAEGIAPPSLRGLLEGSEEISPAEFADRYLHPHDAPYTLDLLREHIQAAGLRFLGWFEARNWDLQELLPRAAERGDFPDDPWTRYEIVEDLFDRDQYDVYLVGPEFQSNRAPVTYDTVLRLNPQVHLTETTFRGYPKSHQARLLFYPEEELDYPQARIARAVAGRSASLGELLAEWGEKRSEEWLDSVIHLVERDILYRSSRGVSE
ncbi:MAG: class I SAM-dependent methyltransferase [Vulcanimicrobiota bacterium]